MTGGPQRKLKFLIRGGRSWNAVPRDTVHTFIVTSSASRQQFKPSCCVSDFQIPLSVVTLALGDTVQDRNPRSCNAAAAVKFSASRSTAALFSFNPPVAVRVCRRAALRSHCANNLSSPQRSGGLRCRRGRPVCWPDARTHPSNCPASTHSEQRRRTGCYGALTRACPCPAAEAHVHQVCHGRRSDGGSDVSWGPEVSVSRSLPCCR